MRISDWSSDVCSSDLEKRQRGEGEGGTSGDCSHISSLCRFRVAKARPGDPFLLAYHSDRPARQRAMGFWSRRERKSCPRCLGPAARWPKAPPINGCETPKNKRTASWIGREHV